MCTPTQNELYDLLLTESSDSIQALIDLNEINDEFNVLNTKITEQEAKIEELQDEVDKGKTLNKLLLDELEQTKKKLEKLENENKQLICELQELREEAIDELDEKDVEIQLLKEELEDREAEIENKEIELKADHEEWVMLWFRIYRLALPLQRWDRFEIRASMSEYELIKKNNTDVFMFNEFCQMGNIDYSIVYDVKLYANLLCEPNAGVMLAINFPVFDTIIKFKDAEGTTNIYLPQIKDIKDYVNPESLVRLYSLERLLKIHYKNKGYKIFSYFVLNQSTNEINYPFVRYSNENLTNKDKDIYDMYDQCERCGEAMNKEIKCCLYELVDERINKVKQEEKDSLPINFDDVINEYRQITK